MAENIQSQSVVVPDILEDFHKLAEINAFLVQSPYSVQDAAQRDAIVESIGERLVGQKIEVTELAAARHSGGRAITRRTVGVDIWVDPPSPREWWHPVTRECYLPSDFMLHPKRIKGKVDGIDASRASIITKHLLPRPAFWSRTWSQVVDGEGEPLVDLKIKN